MTYEFTNHPEIYAMTKGESVALAELVFAYLACTVGPASSPGSHLWTSKYRDALAAILRRACLKPAVSAAAMCFVGRLKQKQTDLELNAPAGLNMFLAALIVADKCVNDHWISRKHWLHIIDNALTPPQILALEMEFLDDIWWDTTLPEEVFIGFDHISAGWKAVREHSYSVDFFHTRRWDNIRPPAFDFFDGLLEEVHVGDMYFPDPSTRAEYDQWSDPVYYDLETSFWEDPPERIAVVDPRERTAPSSSGSSASDVYSLILLNTPSTIPSSMIKNKVPCVEMKEANDKAKCTDEPDPLNTKSSSPSVSEISQGTYDDLSTVDWAEPEPSPSELALLGMRRPRFLLEFAVATLTLPLMYEKGECTETRIEKWLSRVVSVPIPPPMEAGIGDLEMIRS